MIRSTDDNSDRGRDRDRRYGERHVVFESRRHGRDNPVRYDDPSAIDSSRHRRNSPGSSRQRSSVTAFVQRKNWLQFFGVLAVAILVVRLGWVQLWAGPELSELAQEQRTVQVVDAARRGAIEDRNGSQLAFTMEARSITVHPSSLRKFTDEAHKLWPNERPEYDERIKDIAANLPELAGVADTEKDKVRGDRRRQAEVKLQDDSVQADQSSVSSEDILKKLKDEKSSYQVLIRNVDPDKAAEIVKKYPELVAERQDIRHYPNGATGANVIGKIGMDGVGQFGFEASRDATLQGINGGKTMDLSANGIAIPGTTRNEHPAVDGTDYTLTLDTDMQYFVQSQVNSAKEKSGAKDASAVVLDAKSGEVLAMAQADTANPNKDIGKETENGKTISNSAVSNPFEPGSVAKIMTAAAAIEDGVTTPDEVLQVPGQIEMSGVTVKDAWQHDTQAFTTTGVFGKSSNVGTLMLAERLGQDRFADILHKFGLGQSTGIELPGESAGLVPQRPQWSGGTFANLPIGQGMAMTLLQMTSIYQTIANDGERIAPRLVKSSTAPDGTKTESKRPEPVRVISPETAKTVRAMFESVLQSDPTGQQSGTAAGNGLEGYQLTGKTGTAQKVDEDTGAYSNSKYYITFAGIAPADNPRFVIGIMLDEPVRGVHGEGGQSAAPLFKDIAAWALNRYNVPLSAPKEGKLLLQP